MAIADRNITKDDFWLNIAAEIIYSSYEKHTKAVEGLQSLIKWVFGLFTTGSALLFFFPQANDFGSQSLTLFGLAFGVLTIGYFFATKSGFPLPVVFNSQEVESIKKSHNDMITAASKIFFRAVVMTFIGFLLLAMGILVQFGSSTLSKKNASTFSLLPAISTGIEVKDGVRYIPITVTDSPSVRLSIIVRGFKEDPTKARKTISESIIADEIIYASKDGYSFTSYIVENDSLNHFIVEVTNDKNRNDSTTVKLSISTSLKNKK